MRVVGVPEREWSGANALVPRRGMPSARNKEVFMMIVKDAEIVVDLLPWLELDFSLRMMMWWWQSVVFYSVVA